MKRILILAGVTTALASSPVLAQNYGAAGCGLGSLVFSPDGSQISAATSNATGYQFFAITSGTSNCAPASQAAAMEQQESFMVNNYAALSKEMAQGQGETVVGLADTFGCNPSVQDQFAKTLQQNYAKIFSAPGAMAALDAAKREVKGNEALAQACTKII